MSAEQTPPSRANRWAGYLILAAALLFIFGGLGWYNYRAFFANRDHLEPESANCLSVRARITERIRPTGIKNSGATLLYRYQVAGREYEQREDVDESTYLINLNNDSLRICVHRDDPERSNIVGNDIGTVSMIKVVIIDAIMLVVVLVVALQARRIGRKGRN